VDRGELGGIEGVGGGGHGNRNGNSRGQRRRENPNGASMIAKRCRAAA
jgi:hypothetical protein